MSLSRSSLELFLDLTLVGRRHRLIWSPPPNAFYDKRLFERPRGAQCGRECQGLAILGATVTFENRQLLAVLTLPGGYVGANAGSLNHQGLTFPMTNGIPQWS